MRVTGMEHGNHVPCEITRSCLYLIGTGRGAEPISCWFENIPFDQQVKDRLVQMASLMCEKATGIIDGFRKEGLSCLERRGLFPPGYPHNAGIEPILRMMDRCMAALDESDESILRRERAISRNPDDKNGEGPLTQCSVQEMFLMRKKHAGWLANQASLDG